MRNIITRYFVYTAIVVPCALVVVELVAPHGVRGVFRDVQDQPRTQKEFHTATKMSAELDDTFSTARERSTNLALIFGQLFSGNITLLTAADEFFRLYEKVSGFKDGLYRNYGSQRSDLEVSCLALLDRVLLKLRDGEIHEEIYIRLRSEYVDAFGASPKLNFEFD